MCDRFSITDKAWWNQNLCNKQAESLMEFCLIRTMMGKLDRSSVISSITWWLSWCEFTNIPIFLVERSHQNLNLLIKPNTTGWEHDYIVSMNLLETFYTTIVYTFSFKFFSHRTLMNSDQLEIKSKISLRSRITRETYKIFTTQFIILHY